MVAVATEQNAATDLEPYGRLIRMLLPRAQAMAIYGPDTSPLWISGGQDDPDMHRFATDALGERDGAALEISGSSRNFDGAAGYAFVLRDGSGRSLAAVLLLMRDGGEMRPFSLVLGLLRPALECLQRDLAMRASLGMMTRDLSARDQDLELLLDASLERADTPRDADELGRLMQAAVDHLNCAFGALIIPERSVAVVRPHRDQPKGRETEVITRTHRHLMTWAQLQRRTMIVNRTNPGNDRVPPYKIVSVPVRHLSQRVIGFLALFNHAEQADFELRHTRLAELLARKVTSILLTSYDAATGLLSRGSFEQRVDALLAARTASGNDAVIYLDIDRMHVINENFGMHIGDETIGRVADALRRRAPQGSLCARISGDRFALFVAGADEVTAAGIADDIRAAVDALGQQRPEGALRISLSAGVAPVAGASRHPLSHALATAEIACKIAKDHGRNRVETFDQGNVSMIRRSADVQLAASIRDALASDRMRLYAQPVLPLSVGPVEPRFEILIRMLSPEGELVPPAKFLPTAESAQLMPAIDRWVVDTALAQLALHAPALKGRIARFAINLSGQSVNDPDFAAFVEARLAAAGIPPDIVCFEFAETEAIAHLERTEAFMHKLRGLGCQFALDDFGAGASSLAYLRSLPIAVLKIDGNFVRDVESNARSESLIRAVAQLARSMNIVTVAKFVETDALRIRMADVGVDYGQGFAIGKPVPRAVVLQDLSLYELVATSDSLAGGEDIPTLYPA
jgi:diguanylate cyclase (GGDEF)-like protein